MPPSAEIISHWHHSVEDFSTSALDFYQSVEDCLKAKEAPTVRTERIDWNEGGLLSAKREYLRVSYARFSFELCAAPFGKDFFFSWWLTKRRSDSALLLGCGMMIGLLFLLGLLVKVADYIGGFILFAFALAVAGGALARGALAGAPEIEDAILALPVLGALYSRFLKPATYYSEDTRIIFEESVHRVVLHEVDALLKAKGARALAPEETKQQGRRNLT